MPVQPTEVNQLKLVPKMNLENLNLGWKRFFSDNKADIVWSWRHTIKKLAFQANISAVFLLSFKLWLYKMLLNS